MKQKEKRSNDSYAKKAKLKETKSVDSEQRNNKCNIKCSKIGLFLEYKSVF